MGKTRDLFKKIRETKGTVRTGHGTTDWFQIGKKVFLSCQCKEIEENNRRGKTRDLFKKTEIPREHFIQRWAQ